MSPEDIPLNMINNETMDDTRSRSTVKSLTSTMTPRRRSYDYFLGILLLLLVVLLWTFSNFVTQDLFEEGFNKPFLVTYLNTSSFALYLLPWLLRAWLNRRRLSQNTYQALSEEPDLRSQSPPLDDPHVETNSNSSLSPLTTRQTANLASIFCFFWFIANWSVNASLEFTTVGSSTVLASTSGLFTMAVSRILGIERITWPKVAAVFASFAGVVLVSLADSSYTVPKAVNPSAAKLEPTHRLLGDFLAIVSAAFYALYLSLLKVRIKDESRIDMQLFFGFVGLFNVLACWPIGVILHFTGVEPFNLPVGKHEWLGIGINMAVTLSSDFIYVIAMLKTTPLVVTIGLSLTIPLAVVGDFALGRTATVKGLIGALLVLLSFAVVGAEDARLEEAPEPLVHIPDDEMLEGDEEEFRGRSRVRSVPSSEAERDR